MSAIDQAAELNNLEMSEEARPLLDAVKKHIVENVTPITEEFYSLGEGRADRWSWAPGQLELLQEAKDKAKAFSHTAIPSIFGRAISTSIRSKLVLRAI